MALDLTFLNNVTREHFVEGLRNQLYDEMPLMKLIMSNGSENAVGKSLIYDVVLARNVANGQVAGYDPMITQEGNLVTQASLNWADFYYANVSISLTEINKNTGTKEKLVSMLETKMSAAKSTLKENVYKDLFLGVTARGSNNTIVGLAAVCGSTNTYANINRSTAGNEGWKSNYDNTARTDAEMQDPTQGSKYLPTHMRTQLKNAAHDGMPNIVVTTADLYQIYEFIGETHNLRFGGPTVNLGFTKAELGSQTTKMQAQTAAIYWDKYCTAKSMFFLNTDTFKPFVFPGSNFEPADVLGTGMWLTPPNQLAAVMRIIWMGQILCLVPRENALSDNLGG